MHGRNSLESGNCADSSLLDQRAEVGHRILDLGVGEAVLVRLHLAHAVSCSLNHLTLGELPDFRIGDGLYLHGLADSRIGQAGEAVAILALGLVGGFRSEASPISPWVSFLTSGSVTGFTFMALPIPELARPVRPWQFWHLAL